MAQQSQQLNEEQIKALQEKLKNMSPEELKEFQKKQCIFCQIISGSVQSRKIYEDEHVLAVLDINPANPGHILVMPRDHYSIMPQIPVEEIEHLFLVTKMLSNASLRALEVQGSNIIVANGVAAGQRAQHFMIHLIPRKENDKLEFEVPQKTLSEQELQKIQEMLSENLGKKIEEKERPMPVQLMPKRKEIVEAEFEEKPKEKTKPITKKPIKKSVKEPEIKSSKKSKQKTAKKQSKNNEANLDDIAKMLGAK
ncbi:HIT family protein [Candidatus Woesearchaeota archaeon]|nr:HIT family protein [Candidatus Woesearchaeota archaeon]